MNWSCLLNDKCPQDLVAASTDCFSTWSSHPEESKFDLLYIANQLMYRYIRVHTGTYTVYTGTCTVYTGTYTAYTGTYTAYTGTYTAYTGT